MKNSFFKLLDDPWWRSYTRVIRILERLHAVGEL